MKRVRLPVVGQRAPAPGAPGCAAAVCPPGCACGPLTGEGALTRGVTRRQFIAGVGATTVGAFAGTTAIAALGRASVEEVPASGRRVRYAPPPIPGVKFAMAIDLKKCIGCRKCAYACRIENNLGRDSGFLWIELHRMHRGSFELEDSEAFYLEAANPKFWHLAVGCQQCENPPCVQACPVQATWRDPDGIVVIDYDKCIGCRYCMINCPYGARHFNWKRPVVPAAERNPDVPVRPVGVVEKCTFCIHRTRLGKLPRCVEVCPVGARVFGDLNDPKSSVRLLLDTRTTVRLKEHLGTRPRVFLVG